MTFEELRVTYQCPEQMARDLFGQLAAAQHLHAIEQRLRFKAEQKLAGLAPRRTYREEK